MHSTRTISPAAIQEQLERVLASAPFANAQRSQKFLRYIVDCSLKNQDEFLKEFAIAVDVYGRNVSYDPSINATVRVEAGRLRSRLREYYTGEGSADPLIIDVPKGGYRVTFTHRDSPEELYPAKPDPAPSPLTAPPASHLRPMRARALQLAIAAILILAGVTIAIWKRTPPAGRRDTGPIPSLSSPEE